MERRNRLLTNTVLFMAGLAVLLVESFAGCNRLIIRPLTGIGQQTLAE